jgi:hypothetical protein
MSMVSAWMYNGGNGVAGFHYEDSFLHFAHFNLHVSFEVRTK